MKNILDLLFGNDNNNNQQTIVTDDDGETTWSYPGPLTEEVAEIFQENGYAVVEQEEQEEQEAQPWWKLW